MTTDGNGLLLILKHLQDIEENVLTAKQKQYFSSKNVYQQFEKIATLTEQDKTVVIRDLMSKNYVALSDFINAYAQRTNKSLNENEKLMVSEYIIDIRNYLLLLYGIFFSANTVK